MIISGVICRKWFGTGNRCNFVDELRVKGGQHFHFRNAAHIYFHPVDTGENRTHGWKMKYFFYVSIRRIYCSYICFAISWESADIQRFKMWNA